MKIEQQYLKYVSDQKEHAEIELEKREQRRQAYREMKTQGFSVRE